MREIKKVAIIGLGAIGSIYALKIHEFNPRCLQVILDQSRYEKYIQNGLNINNVRYDFNYVLPGSDNEKVDLILIATKSNGLLAALEAIEGFVGPNTIIMSLLNGISSEELIAEKFGWDKVLYSFFIGHISTRVDNNVSHDGVATIVFGEADNTMISDKTAAVRDFFAKAGIEYQIPQDMMFALWSKFMINVGYNQSSAVLLAPYRVFQECDQATAIANKLMDEVVSLAVKAGIKNPDKMLEAAIGIVQAMPPAAKSSMLQDVEAKRQTEVDIFAGTVCALGKKYNVATPYNEVFLHLLNALDQKNAIEQQREAV